MIDKLVNFMRKHAYETLLSLFFLIFGGSIMSAWRLSVNAIVEYPLPFVLFCAISFVCGLIVSAVRDRRSALLEEIREETKREIDRRDREDDARRERERLERQEAERMRTVRNEFVKQVMEMDYGAKVAFATLYEVGEIILEWDDPYGEYGFMPETEDIARDPNHCLSVLEAMHFASYESTDWNERKWALRENVVYLMRDNECLIECVKRDDQKEMFGIE